MIVVGGFNSAIDKRADVDRIAPGAVIRMRHVRPLAGGKGLHVALACATLGQPVTLVGLTDEGTRASFERALAGPHARFVGIDGGAPIRTCLALHDDEGHTTELLEPGPEIPPSAAAALVDVFVREAAAARCAALSGSLPPGMAADTYARSIAAAGRDKVALDASGDALALGLAAAPLLVKPNRQEAGRLLGRAIETRDEAAAAAAAIGERGPRIVLLSLGADGAILHADGRSRVVYAPAVRARNTVGAGDCLLGGFLVGLVRGWSVEECARYAVACGTAKVMHPDTGVLAAGDVEDVLRAVRVVEIAPG